MDDRPINSLPERPKPDAPPRRNLPAPLDDAGPQALSEALRSSFAIVKIIMVLLVLAFFGSGIFTVPSQEKAVVLRFGKPVGTQAEQLLGPGLHWAWPYPIDEVLRIPYTGAQSVSSTVGWYATAPDGSPLSAGAPQLNPATDGYALSSDTNIVHIQVTAHYRVSDPLRYALDFVKQRPPGAPIETPGEGASNLVQHVLNNAVFRTASEFTVDQILRQDPSFQDRIVSRVRELADQLGLGIVIDQKSIKTQAPDAVQKAFQDVIDAANTSRTAINQAQAAANQIVSAARGETNNLINVAQSDSARMLALVQADAKYFTSQLPSFAKDPKLFAELLQVDALRHALTNRDDKFFLPGRADGKPRELRLQLSREPRTPPTTPAMP